MNRLWWTLAVAVALCACGDDTETSTTSASGGSPTGATGGGGSGATGGTAGAGGGTGGMAGMGGMPFVDPIAGIDPVQQIETNYAFTEGTVWMPAQSLLYFSDIDNNDVYTIDENDTVNIWHNMSNATNGNALDIGGNMISCEQSQRRVVRHTDFGNPNTLDVVAAQYNGMLLNRPNDAIVRSDGMIYFTDPNYSTPNQQLPFQGVFWIDTTNNDTLTLIDDTMNKPNGIALSPDETKLYVTDAAMNELWSFDVNADGSIAAGSKAKLADTNNTPDGFGVDDQGYLYLTTQAGIDVHAPDGSLFGNIPVPEQPANCAFGGADRRTLFITARTSVYKVTLNVPGLP